MRAFFSLIIPTFNSERFIRDTLDSIVSQNFASLELVIADDQSTDNTVEICKSYSDRLDVKVVSTTNQNHNPGNTRQFGLDVATGEWIMFMDHDDMLAKNALKEIKALIKRTGATRFVCTNLDQINRGDKRPFYYHSEISVTWLHGKAYKREFIDEYNIHFNPEMFSHEDLFFNQQVWIALHGECVNIDYFIDKALYTYHWVNESTSLSRSWRQTGEKSYIEENFGDYLEALLTPLIAYAEKFPEKAEYARIKAVTTIPFLYFYIQSFKYQKDEVDLEIIKMAMHYMALIRALTQMTPTELVNELYADPDAYLIMRNTATPSIGAFVETESLAEFIFRFSGYTDDGERRTNGTDSNDRDRESNS